MSRHYIPGGIPGLSCSESALPIFSDPTKKRSRRIRVFGSLSALGFLLWCAAIALHIFDTDQIKFDVYSLPSTASDKLYLEKEALTEPPRPFSESGQQNVADVPEVAPPERCAGRRRREDSLVEGSRDTYAFLTIDPVWSYTSLEANCSQIDVLLPAWFEFAKTGKKVDDLKDQFNQWERIDRFISEHRNQFALMPTLALSDWTASGEVEAMLGTVELRQSIVNEIVDIATSRDFDGICFDASNFPPEALGLATKMMQQLESALYAENLTSCAVMNFDNLFWMNPDLVAAADRIVVTMIREPFEGSSPSPVAPQQWFVESAALVTSYVPSQKLVLALGTGGFDWISGRTNPVRTDYTSIVGEVAQLGGQMHFFDIDLNSQATYIDREQKRHVSWLLDAASFYNQLHALERYGLAGVAVWTIGREDPGVWDVLALQGDAFTNLAARLSTVSVAGEVRYFGVGPFFRFASEATTGRRILELGNGDGLIRAMAYDVLPVPILIERLGGSSGNRIALTFDDGPDPVFTDQVLDVLREKEVSATFFVVGSNIMKSPKMLKRIVKEGHILGSHSFFHPRLEEVSERRVRLELNGLQRLVAGITGRRLVLYRTPYGNSTGPDSAEFVQPTRIATSLGYLEMGSDIVTYDWNKISADEIAGHVRQGVRGGGRVVMLHDGGGSRQATIQALGPLIDQMRTEGFVFVSPAELLRVSVSDLMPRDDSRVAGFDGISFNLIVAGKAAIYGIFWLTVLLGILRSAIILFLALKRPSPPLPDPAFEPSVTVVVSAYNEAKVIEHSIKTILASNYTNLRVLVVDDGSNDGTRLVLRTAFHNEARVKVRSQPNGGKWTALNTAYQHVSSDIVVAIDADTIVCEDAIRILVGPFSDPSVGAVAGNVKVGNRLNLLTRLQALEYVTSQNLERRAFESVGAMLVVPGAIGAWRVTAVKAAGGYSGDTLAEDSDLTVSIQRSGYRVCFAEEAIAFTEAPAAVVPFLKQRLRWTLGMMQMSWKHRTSYVEGRTVGLFSLTDLQIFGVLFALFGPVADLVLITTVGVALNEFLAGRPPLDPNTSYILVAGYILLPLMDAVLGGAAIYLDRRHKGAERYSMLWVLPFQRIFYRQLLYVTVYRSVLRALTGRLAKWNSLKRMGTVKMAEWI